jgi:hypothetical protein
MANSGILTRQFRATFKVALILFFVLVQGCSWYSKPAYSGRVVDAETGQPLSQVHIVIRYGIGVYRLVEQGSKQVTEFSVITGKDGKFSVPAVRSIISILAWDEGVSFTVTRSGYAYLFGDISVCMSIGCNEKAIPTAYGDSKTIYVSSNLIQLPKI